MIYLGLLLLAYLVTGLAFSMHFSYREWQAGEDFTVSELWRFFVRVWIWPLVLVMMLDEIDVGSIVLIRGSRSARVLRELRKDEN